MSSEDIFQPDPGQAAAAPSKLMACFARGVQETALAQIFGQDPAISGVVSMATVTSVLHADAGLRMLILYETPASYVAQRVNDKATPEAALEEWRRTAREITAALGRHRNRIILVSLDMAAQYPGVLATRLGMSSATAVAMEATARPTQDPLLRILVANALRQEIDLQVLAGEIEASALNLSNHEGLSVGESREAFTRYLSQQAELEDLRAETRNQKLYAEETYGQLEQTQARIADLTATCDALKADLERTGQEAAAALEQAREDHDALELTQSQTVQKARDLEATLKVLKDQLGQSQQDQSEQMRKFTADRDALKGEKAALHQKLAEAETWLHGIQASRSYRIMAPLRRLRQAIKRKEHR